MSRIKNVRKVLLYTLFLNVSVAAAKIIYGYTIGSISMRSDGFHSFFDGASNIIGLVGIWIASQPPDEGHPYGHRKFETLATIAIAAMIFATGTEILRESYQRLSVPYDIRVSLVSFVVMAVTLAVNIGVMVYETRKGRELKSDFLKADAMHTRSDIFISLSVVISLIAAKAGYTIVDIIAAFVITLLIAKMGYSILKSATNVLADAACIDPEDIRKVVMNIPGVRECHGIRTRGNKDFINLDLHVLVDPEEKIQGAHAIAHHVEDAVKKGFASVIDVVIHVEPFKEEDA